LEWAPSGTPELPAILLLHGLSSNARYWERVARRLTNRRLVALDQRSHGLSDAPPVGYSLDVLAADAGHAIRELGLNRPLVVGHSWGGTVALEVAATLAELVSGVAVMDGPIASISERITWQDASRMMQPPLPRYRSLEEAYQESRQLLGEAWGEDLQPFVKSGLRRDGDAWVLTLTAPVRLQILEQLYRFRPEAAVAAIEAPLLVGFAANDTAMRAWKEEGARRLLEIRPDADIRWYDSRHDIPLIRPDEVATDLETLARRAYSEY
jgi:pimeloyl-ACP methyl ester carboxylesterase